MIGFYTFSLYNINVETSVLQLSAQTFINIPHRALVITFGCTAHSTRRRLTWGLQHLRGWKCTLHGARSNHLSRRKHALSDAAGAYSARSLAAGPSPQNSAVCCFSSIDNCIADRRATGYDDWPGAKGMLATCPLFGSSYPSTARGLRGCVCASWKSRSHFLSTIQGTARAFPQIDKRIFGVL